MPLFKKQSTEAKKKYQHQVYLAKESPEPVFDISGCELSEVPSGIYSNCKVLRKEVLLLYDNWLHSLKSPEKLSNLETLRVLDIHNNAITELPSDIGILKNLQVLNAESNKIKHLPSSIGSLSTLQTLNLRDNKLSTLRVELCSLPHLLTIDLTHNTSLRSLPKEFHQLKTLQTLKLDEASMKYPAADICSGGTESIMKFLCKDSGVEYVAPSHHALTALDASSPADTTHISVVDQHMPHHDELSHVSDSFAQYASQQERKRQQMAELEKQLKEEQEIQASVASKAAQEKQTLLHELANAQDKLDGEINVIQEQREAEKLRLVEKLSKVEEKAGKLIEHLMETTEKAKHTDELMDQLERERMEREEWFVVRQEETANIRRKDVLSAMEKTLSDATIMKNLMKQMQTQQRKSFKKLQQSSKQTDDKLGEVFSNRDKEMSELVSKLQTEEKLQRHAFEQLLLQQDSRHCRLQSQIGMIEQELSCLTRAEIQHNDLKMDTQKQILDERRETLAKLLVSLMQDKQEREKELQKRLCEMEEQREDDMVDYWLIQYQRLMDRKPQQLINKENQLEFSVIAILQKSGADDYIDKFARHRITIETMIQLTEDDIKQMGVHEVGLRKAILSQIEAYKRSTRKSTDSADESYKKQTPSRLSVPSASDHLPLPPTSPTEVTARGINSECVICMNDTSTVLFLPCGHVCCCRRCCNKLSECPLCRGNISQKVILSMFEDT